MEDIIVYALFLAVNTLIEISEPSPVKEIDPHRIAKISLYKSPYGVSNSYDVWLDGIYYKNINFEQQLVDELDSNLRVSMMSKLYYMPKTLYYFVKEYDKTLVQEVNIIGNQLEFNLYKNTEDYENNTKFPVKYIYNTNKKENLEYNFENQVVLYENLPDFKNRTQIIPGSWEISRKVDEILIEKKMKYIGIKASSFDTSKDNTLSTVQLVNAYSPRIMHVFLYEKKNFKGKCLIINYDGTNTSENYKIQLYTIVMDYIKGKSWHNQASSYKVFTDSY